MLGNNVTKSFLTVARNASEADIRSIPYAGEAVWKDVKLLRTSLINKEMLLAKPHVRKILKHSGNYITSMCSYYQTIDAAVDQNEADGFTIVDAETTEKTEEIDHIVAALKTLSVQNLRTIKSLVRNTEWP